MPFFTNGMNTFQTIVLGIFVFFLLAGIAAFALFRGGGAGALPTVLIWGTLPNQTMLQFSQDEGLQKAGVKFEYVQKYSDTFENDFVEALASGKSPDLVIFPHDLLLKHQNKLAVIPLKNLSERQFKDSFIEGGEVFFTSKGALGFPILVDPLVMYWNRSMFSDKGIGLPPKNWDEFFTIAPKFNQKNKAGNLNKTIVALGETLNIANFKDILSALIIQAGSPIVALGADGKISSVFNQSQGFENPRAEAALRFYTEFSNPVKPIFSWNKSLPNSKDAFLAEELATYFGFGSELASLRSMNPNLNFDVATLPQIRDGATKTTYGKIYGLVIPKSSQKISAAFTVASQISSTQSLKNLSELANLPPSRRDLLSVLPESSYQSVFYQSAIMTKAWSDPSPTETDLVFRDMFESVTSGKTRLNEAINRADKELESLLKNLEQ